MAAVQEQLAFPLARDPDELILPGVPEGTILSPAQRMERIRVLAAATDVLDKMDKRLAQLDAITGDPPSMRWRGYFWLEMGILGIPGRGSLPGTAGKHRARARQWIAEADWRKRVERKRRVNRRFRRIAIELAGGLCHYCDQPVAEEDFTIDHIIPVTRGGRSYLGNLVACCWPCNHEKRDQLIMEWRGTNWW